MTSLRRYKKTMQNNNTFLNLSTQMKTNIIGLFFNILKHFNLDRGEILIFDVLI